MADDREEQMRERFDKLETKVDNLEKKVDHLDQRVDTMEERLSNNFKIAVEEMKDSVKKLGEGYQAGLDTILREMKDMNRHWESKWGIHDRALTNHAHRLNKLEGGSLNK